MKYYILILSLLFFACNGEKKSDPVKIEVADTTEVQPQMLMRAFADAGQAPIITETKDTVYFFTKDTTVTNSQTVTVTTTYPVTRVETRKFNGTVTPPPPPPTTGVKYLSLPKGVPQTYTNRSGIVIENLSFASSGTILTFMNCTNVTIRNCYFGPSASLGMYIQGGSNFTIEKNLFANNATHIYVQQSTGGIKIIENQFVNTKGPFIRGQVIQFNTVTGAGNLIEWNRGENFVGRSSAEDLVSLYNSKGTQASPITVRNNIFRGGGPSGSGGGIMAGDQGGQWILVENNKLVNPGHYGIVASGGFDITIRNNDVYADAGNRVDITANIGYYLYNAGGGCGRITFTGNRANWTNYSSTGTLIGRNDFGNPGQCTGSTIQGVTSTTLASMAVPAHLITFITAPELLTIK